MTKFIEQQLQQQSMFSQMTPEQKQQYRNRLAQRASQKQNWQPQGQHQQVPQPPQQQDRQSQGSLSPSQQQYVRRQTQLRQQHGKSPTLSANSHMPTLPLFTMQTKSASPGQRRQQVNASNGFTPSRQPRIPPLTAARYQQSPPRQGHAHAQTKQQSSTTKRFSPPIAGQKRLATDAPEGTRPAEKRLNLMPRPGAVTHTSSVYQNASPSRQPGAYHQLNGMSDGTSNGVAPTTKDANRERQEQQARGEAKLEAERRRMREHQARAAGEARVAEQYRIAHAAALQREKDDKRKAELQKDPSANFRHILEVYKLMPLKKGELPNKYLTGLIANRPMPMDLDCDLALAITFAKSHWDYYGQWPKDIARFASYEKERRAKHRA